MNHGLKGKPYRGGEMIHGQKDIPTSSPSDFSKAEDDLEDARNKGI
jgi:hypothetical protein